MYIVFVFNVFQNVFCVQKPFPEIYVFSQFTPSLFDLFKSVKEGFCCILHHVKEQYEYERVTS
jgi:hypothetical protein